MLELALRRCEGLPSERESARRLTRLTGWEKHTLSRKTEGRAPRPLGFGSPRWGAGARPPRRGRSRASLSTYGVPDAPMCTYAPYGEEKIVQIDRAPPRRLPYGARRRCTCTTATPCPRGPKAPRRPTSRRYAARTPPRPGARGLAQSRAARWGAPRAERRRPPSGNERRRAARVLAPATPCAEAPPTCAR